MQSTDVITQPNPTHPLEDSIFSNTDASITTDHHNLYPIAHSVLEETKNLTEILNLDSMVLDFDRQATSQVTKAPQKKKKTLDDFEILNKNSAELGRGSYSKVQLVREKAAPHRLYAMKVVNKEDLRDQNQVERLKREVKIQRKLKHPNIVKLIYNFEDKNHAYLILQHVKNGNLRKYLNSKKHPLKEEEAFLYFVEVCLGLDYLHKKGIVHRDVKTENLLIDGSGNAMLSDFGLSVEDLDKRNTFCGTLDYMAPEMIQNLPHDYKVDIWALGIVLYELLHGYTPYKGLSYESTIDDFKQEIRFGQISVYAKWLIQSLLQIDPNDRPEFPAIFNHPWMKKHATENGNLNLMEYLERNLSTEEERPLSLRKTQSTPVQLTCEQLLDKEAPIEVYDSIMGEQPENIPGANDKVELVMLNGPLIVSETTDANESSTLRIENIESEENNNATPLKRNFSQQDNKGYSPVTKGLVSSGQKDYKAGTPTTGSIKKRGLLKKKKENKENRGVDSEVEENSPTKRLGRSVSPAPAKALGLNGGLGEDAMEEVQLFKRPIGDKEEEVKNREYEEMHSLPGMVDLGEEKGNKETVWQIGTGDSGMQFEDIDKKIEAYRRNEEIEKIVDGLASKDETALENMFPAGPLKVSTWTNPMFEKPSVRVSIDDFVVERPNTAKFGEEVREGRVDLEGKKEENVANVKIGELEDYLKKYNIKTGESTKPRNYVCTTDIEPLPVTLKDGPLVAQVHAILEENKTEIQTRESNQNEGLGDKEVKGKLLEPSDVSRLLSSFKEEENQKFFARREKDLFPSLQKFETVGSKLEKKTSAPYTSNSSKLMPKTEVDFAQGVSSLRSSKTSEAGIHLSELFKSEKPRGAIGHVDNSKGSSQFGFGRPNKVWTENKEEVPYVYERVGAVGTGKEERPALSEFESERNIMLSDYKAKLNNLTSIKKSSENRIGNEEEQEELVAEPKMKPSLRKLEGKEQGKKVSKALTFDVREDSSRDEEEKNPFKKFNRKKGKGSLTEDPKSFYQRVKESKRKNEKLDLLLRDIDYDSERVSRPSLKNPMYVPKAVPKKEAPQKKGFLSKVMVMLGCVDREEQQALITKKDIRDVGFSFKELRK